MMKKALLLALALSLPGAAFAAEYPIGKPAEKGGMEIGAVYLQPIEMDPPGMMRAAKDSDVHLEADIHATAGNATGFPEGEWVPYLVVKYEVQKVGSDKVQKGTFMPMVANDGPHYGDNVKLDGPGKYKLKYTIMPPTADKMNHFGRHIDKETGVGPWFEPFDLEYEFVFAGTGKKGGY
ncbi:Pathogen-specific membrane antigen [Bordetella pertussis]|uniref:Exported protein n=4 Tax=Bordetella pertussis TaxID=520 RepID=Q7VYZ7_BORPE|nr:MULTISPECIES: iron transporter [Bordetella]ETH39898.1 Fe2+ transport protein [Bordetella pertussis H918]ETH41425.1 Fe2+ transport protein [Bordetella pertussis H939]ETH48160.1 Fe2+ transport protein [Bordetella pertussis H921]ETH69946.1 Fe2+ transport protein [Bordetella pertussis STO1-CHLA-0011]ETH84286.1 Fe2+ transport protein [Bordetella pertussis STO1-CHOC-0017]ETH91280.1 Fe2+ transport protein [Bordetella pertussis STO1-CHOC-0019]ETH99342.1 Fe2+ transport protein [Bordetella pertussi